MDSICEVYDRLSRKIPASILSEFLTAVFEQISLIFKLISGHVSQHESVSIITGHIPINRSCLCVKFFLVFQYQPISWQYYWLSNYQPIRIWLSVAYKHQSEFPMGKERYVQCLHALWAWAHGALLGVPKKCPVVRYTFCSKNPYSSCEHGTPASFYCISKLSYKVI